ncbi:MAG TPA: radical SAM protein [bacterium]|nr:radical SAM protein [bacterium]
MKNKLINFLRLRQLKNLTPESLVFKIKRFFPNGYKYIKFNYTDKKFLTVFMDLHTTCDAGCKMCHWKAIETYERPKKEVMSIENFKKIADNIFPYTCELVFSPCSEVLLNPEFDRILDMLPSYHIPLCWMLTNLNHLKPHLAEKIVLNKIHRLLISMDSHKPEIYKSIKQNLSFKTLIDNINLIKEYKRKFNSDFPRLTFNFVLMKTTIDNYDGYMDFVKEIGGESVGFFHVVVYEEVESMKNESLWEYKKEYNEFYDKVILDSIRTGVKIERIPDKFTLEPNQNRIEKNKIKKNEYPPLCPYPWYMLVVNPDGSFKPCEFWSNQENWRNLITDDFKTVWERDCYKKLRWEISTRQPSRSCCQNCVSMSSNSGRTDDETAFKKKKMKM